MAFGELPLSFEANEGQADSEVDFLVRGAHFGLSLTPTDALLSLAGQEHDGNESAASDRSTEEDQTLDMRVLGGDSDAEVAERHPLPGRVNYLNRKDPSQWQTNIPPALEVVANG